MNTEVKAAPDPATFTNTKERVAHLTYGMACCGLVMEHSVHREYTPELETPQSKVAARQAAFDVLTYWLTQRVKDHDCALVSPENPLGNRRKIMDIKAAREARIAAGWRE